MTRKMYLEKFKFMVFPCINNEKRPAISDWRNQAEVNPAITGNYGVLASGHPYKDGTIVVVDLDNHSEKEESGVQFWKKNLLLRNFLKAKNTNTKHLKIRMLIRNTNLIL